VNLSIQDKVALDFSMRLVYSNAKKKEKQIYNTYSNDVEKRSKVLKKKKSL
jgi:aromatic ring-opening dioxygenase LigB subunit